MSQMATYETEFGVIEFTTAELLSLPAEQRDFIMAASLIMNAIRFHWSIFLRSPTDSTVDDLKALQIVRWFWCTRKLAGVIVEAYDCLNGYCGKIPALKALAQNSVPILSKENKKSKNLELAREFRNKSVYHYKFLNEVGRELSTFENDALHRIFAHQQSGNSISELAEQIHTLPTLKRITGEQNFDSFNNWCSTSSGTIMNFCENAVGAIIRENFPNKSYRTMALKIQDEAESMRHRWPLFAVT